jgi:hypothetical protein
MPAGGGNKMLRVKVTKWFNQASHELDTEEKVTVLVAMAAVLAYGSISVLALKIAGPQSDSFHYDLWKFAQDFYSTVAKMAVLVLGWHVLLCIFGIAGKKVLHDW